MTKRGILVLVLAAFVAGGAFAQFSFIGGIDTSFTGVTPTIGAKIGTEGPVDILFGLNFSIVNTKIEADNQNSNRTSESGSIGIYGGVAIKASLTEKWSVSMPLLLYADFGESGKTTYVNNNDVLYTPADPYFEIGFRTGGRAEYAFNEKWGIYTGFLWTVFSFSEYKDYQTRIEGVSIVTYLYDTTVRLNIFNRGLVQLGITYKF